MIEADTSVNSLAGGNDANPQYFVARIHRSSVKLSVATVPGCGLCEFQNMAHRIYIMNKQSGETHDQSDGPIYQNRK